MSRLHLGLVGRGVGHSRSPALHAAGLRALNLDGCYGLLETWTSEALLAHLASLRAGSLSGLNVTTPWKAAAASACDVVFRCDAHGGLRPLAATEPRTPVNTLFMQGHDLCGTSTDGPGLGLALARAGVPFRGRTVAVIGAGGAGASVAHWLVDAGADVRWLCNRSPAPAAALARALRQRAPSCAVVAVPWAAPAPMVTAELIVHASRVGHGRDGAAAEAAARTLAHLPWRDWAVGSVLVDVVYGAGITAAQHCARAAGGRFVADSGRAMLACQAALSLAVWTGRPAPVEALLAVV